VRATVWHGDATSILELVGAVEHNCTCLRSPAGVVNGSCPAHQALLDQRVMDGLLFARFLLDRLLAQEFGWDDLRA